MNLDDFIESLQDIRDEYGGDLEIAIQIPPNTKCWEDSWTQLSVGCISTDGGAAYIQTTKQ